MIIYFIFLRIRIIHVLCIGNNCLAKDNFPLTIFRMDNKGNLYIYLCMSSEAKIFVTVYENCLSQNSQIKTCSNWQTLICQKYRCELNISVVS